MRHRLLDCFGVYGLKLGPVFTLTLLILLLLPAVSARAALTDSLIGYWPFDGNGNDLSGAKRDLDLFGGLGFSSGRLGQGLDFHANNQQYAQRPVDDDVFNFYSSDFSIQVWVNYASDFGSEQTIVEKFSGTTGPNWTLTSFRPQGLQFFSRFGSTRMDDSIAALPFGTWHQVIVRRAGSSFSLFADGSLVGTTTSAETLDPTSQPLLVGKRNDFGQAFPFDGRIDELAIWNRALSDSEIAFLYNGGAGNPVTVPEPATIALAVIGAIGCGFVVRRRMVRER